MCYTIPHQNNTKLHLMKRPCRLERSVSLQRKTLKLFILTVFLSILTMVGWIASNKQMPFLTINQSPSEATLHQNNRTLVVVTGSLRSGEQAWESLYTHVLDPNHADLALITEDLTPPQYRNSSLFLRAKYHWQVHKYEDWSDAFDLVFNSSAWRKPVFDMYKGGGNIMLGGINGVRASGGIIFMFRWFLSNYIQELNLTAKYDRFVVTRSDHYYFCHEDLSKLDLEYLWVPSGEDYSGICDRHFVASSRDILKALNTLPPLLANPLRYKDLLTLERYSSEPFLLLRWKEDGLATRIRRYPRTMFVSAQATDESRWGEATGNAPLIGLKVKYLQEYYDSRSTCFAPRFNWNRSRPEKYSV